MRAIIQRVSSASVVSDGTLTGQIGKGFLVLLGIEHEDAKQDAVWLADKIRQMRIFGDAEGKMNLAISEVGGEILLVSQFTLFASTKKGNRPSFIKAAKPDHAIPLYEFFRDYVASQNIVIKEGVFGADMKVNLLNDGPVTIVLDSKNPE
ncbi:MAG TPA: D-aminoacyl-tRNA deacylase [Saprospiraceae bacterium]|nr:D-aminoacyl-tRNA deacylase [Saprospiraceae bacterium]